MVRRVRTFKFSGVRCRVCSAPMRLQNSALMIELLEIALDQVHTDPEGVLQTYQCARRAPDGSLCNALVEVRVRHWREI